MTYIQVQTKYATYKGKYGKIYASKEKLYATHSGFMIPKGCFFEARFDNYLCIDFSTRLLIPARIQTGYNFMVGNGNKPENGESGQNFTSVS